MRWQATVLRPKQFNYVPENNEVSSQKRGRGYDGTTYPEKKNHRSSINPVGFQWINLLNLKGYLQEWWVTRPQPARPAEYLYDPTEGSSSNEPISAIVHGLCKMGYGGNSVEGEERYCGGCRRDIVIHRMFIRRHDGNFWRRGIVNTSPGWTTRVVFI